MNVTVEFVYELSSPFFGLENCFAVAPYYRQAINNLLVVLLKTIIQLTGKSIGEDW